MTTRSSLFALVPVLLQVGIVNSQESQHPIMDKIAQKVVRRTL